MTHNWLIDQVAAALIQSKFFAQDDCQREWIRLPAFGWTAAQVAQVNVKLLTKLRLAVVLSIPEEGDIAALLYRGDKREEWSYELVTDSSRYFFERGRSHKTQVPKVHAADIEKAEKMEAQLGRLGFSLYRNFTHNTFTGLKGLYPTSYNNAQLECSFVECVAVAFMHINSEVLLSLGIHAIVKALAFDFLNIAVDAAQQLARAGH